MKNTFTKRNWSSFWLEDDYDFDGESQKSKGIDYKDLFENEK